MFFVSKVDICRSQCILIGWIYSGIMTYCHIYFMPTADTFLWDVFLFSRSLQHRMEDRSFDFQIFQCGEIRISTIAAKGMHPYVTRPSAWRTSISSENLAIFTHIYSRLWTGRQARDITLTVVIDSTAVLFTVWSSWGRSASITSFVMNGSLASVISSRRLWLVNTLSSPALSFLLSFAIPAVA